jgi:type IV pilus assembly protein PilC
MASFRYVAKDSAGKTLNGTMDGETELSVVQSLRKQGMTILSVELADSGRGLPKRRRRRVRSNDLVVFSRQLATMVDAGLPLIQSLDALHDQTDNPGFKAIIGELISGIEQGASFSDALGQHPKVFSGLFVNMVRAGETSGTLAEILDRVAGYLEASAALRRRVKSAMIYPAVVSTMAVAITILLLVKVIPVFENIYKSFDSELPGPTKVLLAFSKFLRGYFFIGIGAIVGAVIGFKMWIRTDLGRMKFDRFKFHVPVFGQLNRKISVSRFTRTLGVLVRSGVPILSALDIVGRTAGNKVVEAAVNEAIEEIKRGENIADPLAASHVFPPMVTRMISVGESSGKLEIMLEKISDFYDDEVNATVGGLTSLIEPLLIAFLGIVVGGIVICMFMPLFKLSTIVAK